MGDNYLHEQAENARKRRDKARQDLKQPRLLNRPDQLKVIYNVVPASNEQLKDGETLRAVPARGRDQVDVLRKHLKVATIEGDGGRKLRAELSKPENGGLVSIRISNVSSLSGGADARLVKG